VWRQESRVGSRGRSRRLQSRTSVRIRCNGKRGSGNTLGNGNGNTRGRARCKRRGSRSFTSKKLEFIKYHMLRDIYPIGRKVKAAISFLGAAITNEDALGAAEG
jgi:hypothetical protein